MKEVLRFSVLMCVYGADNPDWFSAAFESIRNQSRNPDEILLVVDGPVPEMLDRVIRSYEKDCTVIRLPENRGHGEARRIALEACRTELAAWMDADDISLPNRFARQLAVFEEDPTVSAVGGMIAEFEEDPQKILGLRVVKQTHEKILKDMKIRCPMNQVTVMLRKSHVQQAGGYQDRYCNEDYFLWLRMALAGQRFRNLPDVLVKVRTGPEMYRRRAGWKYFKSEAWLQRFMLKNKIIGPIRCGINLGKRALVQLLLPGSIRRWVFRRFARKAGTEWTDRVKQ